MHNFDNGCVKLLPTLLYMVCCVFQATKLVNNYRPRKSARTFVSKQKASNKLYTVLAIVFIQGYSFYYKILQLAPIHLAS